MNLHTTQIERKPERKRNRKSSRRSKKSFAPVLRIITLLLMIFLFASARAVINSEIEKLNRQAVNLKAKVHNLNREVANLQIKREKYRGRYVLDQIRERNLKLCYPRAGQVRKLKVSVASKEELDKATMANLLLSQR